MANHQMGLLGRKLGMTQHFDESGAAMGVTVIEVGSNVVYQVKSKQGADGYSAIQLGVGARREVRTTKAQRGHAAKANAAVPKFMQEVRVPEAEATKHTVGATLSVGDVFKVNDRVDVRGVSKGRGFAGVLKRHHFSGFGRSHGVHEYKRHGGSIGTRLTPGMTFKGVRMAGHLGAARVTVQNMQVVKVDTEKNVLFVKGGVPGPNGAHVVVRKTVKRRG